MVLQKRLDYGSSGHQVPAMPHVPRSARGKRSVRKKVEDNQMCAFDMLATVAGELLSDRENSSFQRNINGVVNVTTAKETVKQELLDEEKPFKTETFDQGSCDEGSLGSDLQRQVDHPSKECSQITEAAAAAVSDFIKSDTSYKDGLVRESVIGNTRGEYGYSLGLEPEKCGTERHSPGTAESFDGKREEIKTPLRGERRMAGNVMEENATDMFSLEDLMDLDAKPPALVSSDSSAEVPSCRNRISRSNTFPKCREGTEMVVDRDDDENSSGCTHPSIRTTKTFRPQHIEDCKIRKLLSPKYWKVAPTMLYDQDGSSADLEMKSVFRSKKLCYTRQRTQRSSFKRRKLFQRCSLSASDGRNCSEGIPNAPVKCSIKVEESDSHANLRGANGASSSSNGQKSSYDSGDYHVKLSIKSFKVPELFIEMPETATVASLKRTVMEAVTAILGGGLRVGVLLQGKKVRDDNKTLRQTGISNVEKLDSLGFTLEPNPTQASSPLTSAADQPSLCSGDGTAPLARIPPADPTPDQVAPDASPQPLLTPAAICPESDHDSVYSPADASTLDKTAASCKALVPVPSVDVGALAVVPLRKARRSEVAQRRMRRPFSVTEVEALVQAVEKLGTGRWRDVKLRAFDNAKHRTYVDLKDKWKTLVHTARISPQQRRGEPVPQELLDRVLAAHAYWSQQQAKLQAKQPPAETCLLL